MSNDVIKKRLDAIETNVKKIRDVMEEDVDEIKLAHVAILADEMVNGAQKIGGYCRTLALARIIDKREINQ